jgi:DJ-1 family protein
MSSDDILEEVETTIPRALVIMAEGAEEAETVIIVDILRRAGIETVLAGLNGDAPVPLSRKVRILPDAALAQVTGSFDVVILPGGPEGARRLAASELVGDRIKKQAGEGKLVAAICAAPLAFVSHQVFAGKSMACHPSVASRIAMYGKLVQAPVVEDGNLVTSQGPGTSFVFALTLVRKLMGDPRAAEVERGLVLIRG